MGSIKPAWEQPLYATPRRVDPEAYSLNARPYDVAATRVRAHLAMALKTKDDVVQLRRLEQVLNLPARSDKGLKSYIEKATERADTLTRQFQAVEESRFLSTDVGTRAQKGVQQGAMEPEVVEDPAPAEEQEEQEEQDPPNDQAEEVGGDNGPVDEGEEEEDKEED